MRRRAIFAACCAILYVTEARALEVVVSIKPIHSLVAGVMGETGKPRLIVKGQASPHTYQMRPSEARAIGEADLVVWVGETMETFLARAIANLGAGAAVATLHEAAGVRLLPGRPGGMWENDHREAGHDDHADHGHRESGHDKHDGHAHRDHRESGHDGHEDHADHGHRHGAFDMHIWLDPDNARGIVAAVADALARIDPDRAGIYRENAGAMRARIDSLDSSLHTRLEPVRGRAFIAFHDAYQYFEHAYGLNAKGTIAVSPARPPSAGRIARLRAGLVEHDIRCVFSEPQFEPDLVRTLVDGTKVRTAALDPLGAGIEPGPDAWFRMIRELGETMADCLGGK